MDDSYVNELVDALANLRMNEWCVEMFGENDRTLYHCHVTVPSEDATFAAAMAMELAVRQNVSLAGLVGCVAAMVMQVDPEAAPHAETVRKQVHGDTPPVQFDPEHGPATPEGLPQHGNRPAQPGSKHYH